MLFPEERGGLEAGQAGWQPVVTVLALCCSALPFSRHTTPVCVELGDGDHCIFPLCLVGAYQTLWNKRCDWKLYVATTATVDGSAAYASASQIVFSGIMYI